MSIHAPEALGKRDLRPKATDASPFELGYPYEFIGNIQKRW